ncbi:MFS transporter [Streptomyces sp. APSN-46.1]|uniref:MFS transporter n=1 Tax=Streptomyces sp. APSN-46.1 TaxID=2929049 RepID=UPI001FB2AD74|nr:MFS transporter [Streptomyces sp. APSN-46.1]MCJ1677465.1 MFS transporter [Streptomyces sp. APSN-46.1]
MIETLRLARRTPGVLLLLIGNFAVAFGSNIVIPFLAVYLTREQHLSPVVVAMAITVKFWSQQGLSMLGGWIADRVGPVRAMSGGLLVRAVSYLLLLSASGPVQVVTACALLGLGGAIYVPASKAALVRLLGTGDQLRTVFALRSTANNVGCAVGPLAGSLLLLVADPRIGFVVTSAIYMALAVVFLRLRSLADAEEPTDADSKAAADADGAAAAVDRRKLAWVLGCAFAFGFCYIQLEYALPVFTGSVQSSSLVGVLFTVNAIAVVLLQVPLNQYTSKITSSALVICGALLIMTTSFAAASLGSVGGLVVSVLLFSAAEVLIDPRIDSEMANTVPAHRRGMAFGFIGTAMALGGGCANALAAWLSTDDGAPERQFWLLLVAVSAAFAAVLYAASWAVRPRGAVKADRDMSSASSV